MHRNVSQNIEWIATVGGWIMIYERLKQLGRLELRDPCQKPKNHAKWSRPRILKVSETQAAFCSQAGKVTVSNQD